MTLEEAQSQLNQIRDAIGLDQILEWVATRNGRTEFEERARILVGEFLDRELGPIS